MRGNRRTRLVKSLEIDNPFSLSCMICETFTYSINYMLSLLRTFRTEIISIRPFRTLENRRKIGKKNKNKNKNFYLLEAY